MPTPLGEDQWELLAPDADTGFVFGTESTGYQTINRPKVVAGDLRTNDQDMSYEDGRIFGRDYRGAKQVTFEFNVLTDLLGLDPLRANLDYLDALESVWNDEKWRRTPFSHAILRCTEGGVTRRCYGRPRDYDEVPGALTRQGASVATAAFDLFDNLWYSDVESAVDATMIPSSEGGVIAPIVAPITTTRPGGGAGRVVVGGRRPTWPIIEFHGPCANPKIVLGDITVGLTTTIGFGDYVTFDPRPWRRQIVRASDGASMANVTTGGTTAMRNARVSPGLYDAVVSGMDPTGQSFVRVRWRDARSRA